MSTKIQVKHPEWTKNLTLYEVNTRQYTREGTFKAFEEHLPRLKELGVGIIWFMPVQPIGLKNRKGKLGSYYSISDYTAINPEFGTFEDFKNLVDKIHKMGMYVLIDWVANHTAWDNRWTHEHPGFYTKTKDGNFKAPVDDWEDVIHLNYKNPALWDAMIDAMKFWVAEAGVDGFRCDVADLVTTDFWNLARERLDKVKPVFMLAEASKLDLLEKAFDMNYNWKFYHTMNALVKGKKTVADIDALIESQIIKHPKEAYQLFFTSNHDENSWNGSAIERLGASAKAFAVMMFTINGMPLLYGGQEAGNTRRLRFFDKDEIPWKESAFEAFYETLIKLKKDNPALWNGTYGGDFCRINTTDDMSIFAFQRQKNKNTIIVILNLTAKERKVQLKNNFTQGNYIDVFTNHEQQLTQGIEFTFSPWEYKLYKK